MEEVKKDVPAEKPVEAPKKEEPIISITEFLNQSKPLCRSDVKYYTGNFGHLGLLTVHEWKIITNLK